MKRYWTIGLVLVLCLGLVCCGQIEDTNGDADASLAVLTKQDLLDSNSSSKVGFVRTKLNDTITLKVNQFSGVEAVESVRTTQSTERLTFSVQSTLQSGNLYVYVRCDGQIIGDFEIGQSDSLMIEQPAPGKYELCIAGESASFDLTATIQQQ